MSTAVNPSTTARPAAPRLEARGVTVRFGGLVALQDVNLEVPAATIVGLVGPNGAGKSTLFGVLSGLLRPTAGQVWMNGEDVTRTSAHARARRGLARTFQHPELFTELTVRDHLVLAHRVRHSRSRLWTDLVTGRALRRASAEETSRVDELIHALHLDRVQHRPVAGLPLGTSRLVEIGRALALDPQVLLLDEPSSGLDVRETAELATTFARVVEDHGVSLLFVEHDVDLVLSLSSAVHVLDFGVKIAAGPPEQIRTDEAVRAAYLGAEIEQKEQDA